MSLVTRCPKCQSDFVVSLEQLRAHDGLVRCGQCKHIFDGGAALVSNLPTLTSLAAQSSPQPAVLRHRERQPSEPTPTVHKPILNERRDSVDAQRPEPTIIVQGEARLRDDHNDVGRTPPEFLADDEEDSGLKTLIWGFASFFAFVVLLVQLAYIYRNDLSHMSPVYDQP